MRSGNALRATPLLVLVNLLLALLPGAILLQPVDAQGTVRYAAPAAAGAGDCSSWANTCTLQSALAAASEGQIWVQAGLYRPAAAGDREASFALKNNVALFGGFVGTETALGQRNPAANLTVLSGDIDTNDTTDANGVVNSPFAVQGENSLRVVTAGGVGASAVLDGFVITAGASTGLRNTGAGPTLRNLVVAGNAGIGVRNESGSSPAVSASTIRNNAGGVANNGGSNASFTDVTISGNSTSRGGGMANDASSPTLTRVTFSGNFSIDFGAAIFNVNGSAPTLREIIFENNNGRANYGAAISNIGSTFTLTNAVFRNNSAFYDAAIYSSNGTGPLRLTNVLFTGNRGSQGGTVAGFASEVTLTNVTIVGNNVSGAGGMISGALDATIANSIVWGNTLGSGTLISNARSISNSIVQGSGGSGAGWNAVFGTDGGGNKDADPLFVDADGADNTAGTTDDNPRLRPDAPALNAGGNGAVPAGVTTDLDGAARISGGIVDMGAYEAQFPGAFAKNLPATGAVGQPTSPTLSWSASAAASGYAYCLDATDNNQCDGDAWQAAAGLSATVSGLQAGQTYFWQVRAQNDFGVTLADGGAWRSFRTAGPTLASSNGAEGGPGSAFGFSASGFAPGARVTIGVTPPAGAQAELAQAGTPYVAGTVTADADGTVAFAVLLDRAARPGVYTVFASAGEAIVSTQVTVSAGAAVLAPPAGAVVVRGQPALFLPLLRR
ncbi:MAG: right-handed parallel beta-helix repeat-containing protein [Chloroflexi bacterium]|nr:right-handed parallel beta-helix repeat-containing protein [Chloroflexota bacterium]